MLTCNDPSTTTTSASVSQPTPTAARTTANAYNTYMRQSTATPSEFDATYQLSNSNTPTYNKHLNHAPADCIADNHTTSSKFSISNNHSQPIIHTSSTTSPIATKATNIAYFEDLPFQHTNLTEVFEHTFGLLSMTTSTTTSPATTRPATTTKTIKHTNAAETKAASVIATHAAAMMATSSMPANNNSNGTANSNEIAGSDGDVISPSILFAQYHHQQQTSSTLDNEPSQPLFFEPQPMSAATTTTTSTNANNNGKKRNRDPSDTNDSLMTTSSATTTTTTTTTTTQQQSRKKSGSTSSTGSRRSGHTKGQPLDPEDEEKRKNFLERNRIAALKCRQRKKQWLQNLQQRVEYLASDNEQYHLQVNALREELMQLRSLLMLHKDCQHRGAKDDMLHALNRPIPGVHPGVPAGTTAGMIPQSAVASHQSYAPQNHHHHHHHQHQHQQQQQQQQHPQAAVAAAAAAAVLNGGSLSFYNTSTNRQQPSSNSQQQLHHSLLNLNMSNSNHTGNNHNSTGNEQPMLKAEEFHIL